MMQEKPGILIAVEGIDGSGKSTLVHNLASQLQLHFPVITTKEPGGTSLGSELRKLLQIQPVPLSEKAEYLLFAADRAQHFSQVVLPALQANKLVLSDRMSDSSLVYQGYARGLPIEMITMVNTWVMDNRFPNLVLYVDISIEEASERIKKRNIPLSAFEQHISFIKKLDAGFKELYKNKDNVIVIAGNQAPEQLAKEAFTKVIAWIENQQLTKKLSPQNCGLDLKRL